MNITLATFMLLAQFSPEQKHEIETIKRVAIKAHTIKLLSKKPCSRENLSSSKSLEARIIGLMVPQFRQYMQRKKILVAGGAGFIGSQVNQMLHEAGFDTVVLDNLSSGCKEAVIKGNLVVGDMGDGVLLDHLFSTEKIAGVMHFAALIDVGESVREPAKYYENNVVKTVTLLEAMRRHGVSPFIFSSSAAIFGVPEKVPLDEKHPKNPINPYGKTKLMVEEILRDYDAAYGLKFAALRYFNAAGGDPNGVIKNKKMKESNLIPVALKCLREGRAITIFGTDYPTRDGTCVRDYIHIYDLGSAHILALKQLLAGEPSGCYNLGNGKGYTVKEVIGAIERVTGKRLDVIEGERRAGDPPELVADASLAEKNLGWEREYPGLDAMINDAWRALH